MTTTNASLALAVFSLLAASTVNASAAGSPASPTALVRAGYAQPFEPPTRPALLPLPPGAVEPAGCLRDWCLAARDGFTGHMDEYDDEFKRAWALNHRMTGEGLFWYKGAWPFEGGILLRWPGPPGSLPARRNADPIGSNAAPRRGRSR
jgi:hypothetical protein